ncbi:uncharacterized protein LOC113369695 [Ctenocephalides felis]|uniref:uncharacterized protein LOC113369695 n=1 Tax=Ctenocephalides felis TaxID=7515 RepID=UPI000E6E451A|nr:uncharacterized protein LOC113369695 [Ctenocephalides felis]
MALNNNVNCQPSYLRLRIVLILWAYVTLNISAFYQSGLMLSYRYPLRKYQIYKEDEIVSNGLIIGGTDAISMIYGSTDDDNSKYITDNYVDLLALDALNYVAYHKNITTIVTRDYLSFVSADLKKRVFVSPQSIMTIPIELLYSKGFPPAPKFNKMILRFLAGGLFERWKYLVGGALRKNDMEMDELDVERDGIMLEVKDVSGAFVFLIFGSWDRLLCYTLPKHPEKALFSQKYYLNMNRLYKNVCYCNDVPGATLIFAVPHMSRVIHVLDYSHNKSWAVILKRVKASGHQLRNINFRIDEYHTVSCGMDGIICAHEVGAKGKPITFVVPHHRMDNGVQNAIMDYQRKRIVSMGRDGTLVSSGLPWCGDEETEIRKQKAEEFMNNPETRAMFMERKTEGYFDEGPMV